MKNNYQEKSERLLALPSEKKTLCLDSQGHCTQTSNKMFGAECFKDILHNSVVSYIESLINFIKTRKLHAQYLMEQVYDSKLIQHT